MAEQAHHLISLWHHDIETTEPYVVLVDGGT